MLIITLHAYDTKKVSCYSMDTGLVLAFSLLLLLNVPLFKIENWKTEPGFKREPYEKRRESDVHFKAQLEAHFKLKVTPLSCL